MYQLDVIFWVPRGCACSGTRKASRPPPGATSSLLPHPITVFCSTVLFLQLLPSYRFLERHSFRPFGLLLHLHKHTPQCLATTELFQVSQLAPPLASSLCCRARSVTGDANSSQFSGIVQAHLTPARRNVANPGSARTGTSSRLNMPWRP